MPSNLSLLGVTSRRDSITKVALWRSWTVGIRRKPQHILNLNIFQILLDYGLSLLLVVVWSQTIIYQLLGILTRAAWLVLRQAQHRSRTNPLSSTELILNLTTALTLHLLHTLKMLLLLLHAVLLVR